MSASPDGDPPHLPSLRKLNQATSSSDEGQAPDRKSLQRALSLAKKLLALGDVELPADVSVDVRRALLGVHIRLEQWDECEKFLKGEETKRWHVERAYVSYRAGRYDECARKSRAALKGGATGRERTAHLHLLAQSRYRERFSRGPGASVDSYGMCDGRDPYDELLAPRGGGGPEENGELQEVLANAWADVSAGGIMGPATEEIWGKIAEEEKMEDLVFNECTAALRGGGGGSRTVMPDRRGAGIQASRLLSLRSAIASCLASDDGTPPSDAEITRQTCHVSAQAAHAFLLSGCAATCAELCTALLDGGSAGTAVRRVASNNVAAARGVGRELFDSHKRVTAVLAGAESPGPGRLSHDQARVVRSNRAALLLAMGRTEECRGAATELMGMYALEEEGRIALLEAAALRREKKDREADRVLQKILKKGSAAAKTEVQLFYAQEKVDAGDVAGAVSILEGLEEVRTSPAGAATLMAMYDEMNRRSEADALLPPPPATDNGGDDRRALFRSGVAAAAFRLRLGMHAEAATVYKALLDGGAPSEADRLTAVAGLVDALSRSDPEAAMALAEELPPLDVKEDGPNGDELEKMELPRTHRIRKLIAVDQDRGGQPERRKGKKPEARMKERAKAREAYLAKLESEGKFNPRRPAQPDPERWIPKNQRSYNKRGRKGRSRHNIGAQGSGAGTEKDAQRLDAAARAARQSGGGAGGGPTKPSTAHIDVSSGHSGRKGGRRKR